MPFSLTIQDVTWPIIGDFTIARGRRTEIHALHIHLRDENGITGKSEAIPYARYNETPQSVKAQLSAVMPQLQSGLDRTQLQDILPAGSARNGLDCAFWDWEAKKEARPIAELLGISQPKPIQSMITIGIDTPPAMAAKAKKLANYPVIKIKTNAEQIIDSIAAIRAELPEHTLLVDPNESLNINLLEKIIPQLLEHKIALIEQPLPADDDDALLQLQSPIPFCADESCHDRRSLDRLGKKYQLINIKLDKTGGLTEALALKAAARERGYRIMIGSMLCSSLALAPAFYLAQDAEFCDLDGPLLLQKDIDQGLVFDQGLIHPPSPQLWG